MMQYLEMWSARIKSRVALNAVAKSCESLQTRCTHGLSNIATGSVVLTTRAQGVA